MALGYIDGDILGDIADAIREKGGTSGTLAPSEMATAIEDITNGIPIEISTDAGMTAVLTSANVGKAYKFTGTTSTYTNGDIYVVETSS